MSHGHRHARLPKRDRPQRAVRPKLQHDGGRAWRGPREPRARRASARVVDHERRRRVGAGIVSGLCGGRARDAQEEAVVDLVEVRACVVARAVLEVVGEHPVDHRGGWVEWRAHTRWR